MAPLASSSSRRVALFDADNLSNGVNLALGPMTTQSPIKHPFGTTEPSFTETPDPMMLFSTIQLAPIMVFSNIYAFLIVVPEPTEQFGPRTDEMIETFSEMSQREAMSVLVPMLAVLRGRQK